MASEGSLRGIGVTSIGLDKITKARLKRLAGDTPICVKVRELVEQAEKDSGIGGQLVLPGEERNTSPNTIASIGHEVRSLAQKVEAMSTAEVLLWEMFSAALECIGLRPNKPFSEALEAEGEARFQAALASLKSMVAKRSELPNPKGKMLFEG